MFIISSVKRHLHRDICSSPVLHGLVLNLYLNGEGYPNQVDDYFPIEFVEEPDLASKMSEHFADENKHIVMYRKAINRLDQPVLDLPLQDVFNHVIRSHTNVSFKIVEGQGRDQKTWNIANFLAHVHYLEDRVAQSLQYHLDACISAGSGYHEKVINVILTDELKHAEYTRQSVYELLPRQAAYDVCKSHQQAEKLANLDFSITQLGKLLREHRHRFPWSTRWMYSAALPLMRGILSYA